MSTTTRTLLIPAQLDNLGLALLEMAKEMWVLKDRQMVTEALLREKNLLPELDSFQPGPELTARLAAERDRFLAALTSILFDDKSKADHPTAMETPR